MWGNCIGEGLEQLPKPLWLSQEDLKTRSRGHLWYLRVISPAGKRWISTGLQFCDTTWAHFRSFMNDDGSEIWSLSPKSRISSYRVWSCEASSTLDVFSNPVLRCPIQSALANNQMLTSNCYPSDADPCLGIYGAMNCLWQFLRLSSKNVSAFCFFFFNISCISEQPQSYV